MRLFLYKQWNFHLKNKTPIYYVCYLGHNEAAHFLVKKGACYSTQHVECAAENGHNDISGYIEQLLKGRTEEETKKPPLKRKQKRYKPKPKEAQI